MPPNLSASTLFATFVCGAICFVTLLQWRRRRTYTHPLPPGPPRLPVVGNLFQIATIGSSLWETASEWGKTYGDMVYLEVTGFSMLIINTQDVALDLLCKRSANYSSRPQFLMPSLAGWGWTTPVLGYGERLRKHRAMLHKYFLSPELLNYTTIQQENCRTFLRGVLESPENYHKHARRLPAAVAMMNTYGHEIETADDRYVQLGDRSAQAFAGFLGYIFLDLVPWVQYLPDWCPGTRYRAAAKKGRQLAETYKRELFDLTKKKISEGTAKESMTTIFLGNASDDVSILDDENEFANIAATVFLGGGDSTHTTIMNFILAMLKYPEVQHRAQEELDRVVGSDRLPTFQDKEQLPYINALCTEVLRWQVIAPLAIPHCTSKDDEYRGYRIPAGTIVFPNLWAMARDANVYPDPLEFTPERWLPGGEKINNVHPTEYVFGFGRRICPGRVWAEHMLFITAASLLATFSINRALDADGKPVPINEQHEAATIRFLGPSTCKIEPRSEKAASLIRDSAECL